MLLTTNFIAMVTVSHTDFKNALVSFGVEGKQYLDSYENPVPILWATNYTRINSWDPLVVDIILI